MNRTRVTASLLAVALSATMAAGGPPVGDECEDCIPIGDGIVAGNTCDNTGNVDDTSCTFTDTIDEWYCYTASCSLVATATFCSGGGSASYDTALAVFDACGGNELACNDDFCSLQSEVTWDVSAGTTYFIRVSGFNLACGEYSLSVSCQAPNLDLSWYTIDCGGGDMFSSGGGGGGAGGCGDCGIPDPNGLPGCSDPTCQKIVCGMDPFCCDSAWDGICADAAIANCDCGGGTSYELTGTIGQSDTGNMTGGGFELAGGFFGGFPPCPWDCGEPPDGEVGIVDFLALLAQWDMVGTSCDFDGGGVGIVDFLKLLGAWGPCGP